MPLLLSQNGRQVADFPCRSNGFKSLLNPPHQPPNKQETL